MKFQGDCKKEIFVYHYPIRFYVAVKKRERGAREDPTLPLSADSTQKLNKKETNKSNWHILLSNIEDDESPNHYIPFLWKAPPRFKKSKYVGSVHKNPNFFIQKVNDLKFLGVNWRPYKNIKK